MIVLDTTVLVYAVGDDHPLRTPAQRLVEAIGDGLPATTTVEVIQEFAHVRARRRGRDDAGAVATSYADLLGPLLRPTDADVRAGLTRFITDEALGAFDAVLVAAALSAEHVDTLVSADAGFRGIRGLDVVDLADEVAVDRLIRS